MWQKTYKESSGKQPKTELGGKTPNRKLAVNCKKVKPTAKCPKSRHAKP
jgi:hypothetical protein